LNFGDAEKKWYKSDAEQKKISDQNIFLAQSMTFFASG